ncbi:MAG TPA: DUF4159 domain-containing protein [Vicinamibacterales bacterium]|nr:DUF4159 domain-containing protein [Vicinamibacterales bacterium]
MRRALTIALLVAGAGVSALAQRGGGFGGGGYGRRGGAPIEPNATYDGRFAFVRLRYGPPIAFQSQRVQWSHDYPAGERHFMKIMNEVSYLNPHMDESNIMALDDPDLFRYPVAYMCEPGFWYMTDEEAASFRSYLLKGGFVIFDDFAERRGGWNHFAEQMARVLPEYRWFDLDLSQSVYHVFFEVKTLDVPQYYDIGSAVFRGIFEDNDPKKRLIAVANFNTDISEYWEFSDTGFKPIDESNEAYKLGVNYVMYGLTH